MRGHNTRLKKISKSIHEPALITLTVEYANGDRGDNLPLDYAFPPGQEGHVMVKHGDKILMSWLPIDCWTAL